MNLRAFLRRLAFQMAGITLWFAFLNWLTGLVRDGAVTPLSATVITVSPVAALMVVVEYLIATKKAEKTP